MTIPEQHQLAIARKTMRLSCVGALVMGGPNHKESIAIIAKLTGRRLTLPEDCTCKLTVERISIWQ